MIPGALKKQEQLIFQTAELLPSVSLVFPFEPSLMSKSQIESGLKVAMDKVREELYCNFPRNIVKPALNKLKSIISNLEYSTLKKSIAIFLSPFEEKVYYLDIPVKEKIVVNKTLEFRELIQHKKEEKKYLLLVLGENSSNIYVGNQGKLTLLVSNSSEQVSANLPEAAGIADQASLQTRFLKHMDYGLGIILQAYSFPLFVLAPEKVKERFLQVTRHEEQIAEFVPGRFEKAAPAQLLKALQPHFDGWKAMKEKSLLRQAENALNNGKLSVGINEVWKDARDKKGRLLIVEKDYTYPAYFGDGEGVIFMDALTDFSSQNIKDAVDDAIERVLAEGGDVEFVEPGGLRNFMRIALIR